MGLRTDNNFLQGMLNISAKIFKRISFLLITAGSTNTPL